MFAALDKTDIAANDTVLALHSQEERDACESRTIGFMFALTLYGCTYMQTLTDGGVRRINETKQNVINKFLK